MKPEDVVRSFLRSAKHYSYDEAVSALDELLEERDRLQAECQQRGAEYASTVAGAAEQLKDVHAQMQALVKERDEAMAERDAALKVAAERHGMDVKEVYAEILEEEEISRDSRRALAERVRARCREAIAGTITEAVRRELLRHRTYDGSQLDEDIGGAALHLQSLGKALDALNLAPLLEEPK
jgi:hypothetical protein